MLDLLTKVVKVTVNTALLPVSVVADFITLGGVITDKDKPYTAEHAERIMDNIKEVGKPEKKK